MASYPHPVHLYDRTYQPPRIACGKRAGPGHCSPEVEKVSCYDCARQGGQLTDAQRNTAWENANERMEKFKRSPWESAK